MKLSAIATALIFAVISMASAFATNTFAYTHYGGSGGFFSGYNGVSYYQPGYGSGGFVSSYGSYYGGYQSRSSYGQIGYGVTGLDQYGNYNYGLTSLSYHTTGQTGASMSLYRGTNGQYVGYGVFGNQNFRPYPYFSYASSYNYYPTAIPLPDYYGSSSYAW